MNIILLTSVIFTLAIVDSAIKINKPCEMNQNGRLQYNNFINRHILPPGFDTRSQQKWEEYLQEKQLCDRAPVQSFIEKPDEEKVNNTCSRNGLLLNKERNLCISKSRMLVYHVISEKTKDQNNKDTCRIINVFPSFQHVIVVCDEFEVDKVDKGGSFMLTPIRWFNSLITSSTASLHWFGPAEGAVLLCQSDCASWNTEIKKSCSTTPILLQFRRLCNRPGTQSFIPYPYIAEVMRICSSAGRRLQINSPEKGDLCISQLKTTKAKDKMNVILLTSIIFTLVVVPSMTHPKQPCKEKGTKKDYEDFIKKHILQSDFDTSSIDAWKKYLEDQGLCGRVEEQSFIEAKNKENVLGICGSAGYRLSTEGKDWCISQSPMKVFQIKSTKNPCKIEDPTHSEHRVIVACSKVENICRPVHYQKYENQSPGNNACS
ncbi:uncharacterized protein LOC124054203 [Scomber scombrus]|uniref:Uncharacterized protein LOC124054203 n=1 Tax=Scomber scombrus TaxID=13677 RepID=A0AAV1PXF5_SCOSC